MRQDLIARAFEGEFVDGIVPRMRHRPARRESVEQRMRGRRLAFIDARQLLWHPPARDLVEAEDSGMRRHA